MYRMIRKKLGFTLLEILLVLVIMSSILVIALNYTTQKTDEVKRDKASLLYQQIMNASLAYYLNTSSWPASISVLTSNGYLPNITINNPWGNAFKVAESGNNLLYIYSQVPSGSAPLLAQANTLAGRLPLAFVSAVDPPDPASLCTTTSPTCFIAVGVTIPGQNLNNARAINFANVYHSGACVPAPACPAGMTPQIFVTPSSVSGLNDANPSVVYPINSFTAFAVGVVSAGGGGGWAPMGTPSANPGAPDQIGSCLLPNTPQACYSTGTTPISASGNYWRVCLQVVTGKGTTSTLLNTTFPANVAITALTRCAPSNEPIGSDFTVYST